LAKKKKIYVCKSCGHEYPKWQGRCDNCGEWNTIIEQIVVQRNSSNTAILAPSEPQSLDSIDSSEKCRIQTGIGEFDRVLGGGIIPGSVTLLFGEPGIGKSTILLQLALKLAESGKKILYIAGEESAGQIKLRGERLGNMEYARNVIILAENNPDEIVRIKRDIDLVIVDSIQSMTCPDIPSTAGNITQVRQAAAIFIQFAKENRIPVFLVGHITKSGVVAGPKILEHAVDVVLYLEGDSKGELRFLRGKKNRYGSTGEIGVFKMVNKGFKEITNPSSEFISHRNKQVPGRVIYAGLEGQRPLFVEIQALTAQNSYGNPQRVAHGIDYKRLMILSAILESRAGFSMYNYDVFVNVVSGVKISEPASDLAVLTAIAGSIREMAVDDHTIMFGEVGLTGEIRQSPRAEARINEASRLGFKRVITSKVTTKNKSIEVIKVDDILTALNKAFRE